jgi:SAM-dependent MidA family methyltransferase
VLSGLQRQTLEAASMPLAWHARLEDVPQGPIIVIANEFFDALPIRQFVSQGGRWHARMVGLEAGRLAFGLDGAPAPGMTMRARDGDVLEVGFAGLAVMEQLAGRLARDGGAALVIDYGHGATGFGDTLQAVKGHAFADPLEGPGEADLTAHVDFAALLRQARASGAAVHGPVTQATFLERLGARERATALRKSAADEETRAGIASALARLTDTTPKGMGSLFKAIALTSPGLPVPAGFETQD